MIKKLRGLMGDATFLEAYERTGRGSGAGGRKRGACFRRTRAGRRAIEHCVCAEH